MKKIALMMFGFVFILSMSSVPVSAWLDNSWENRVNISMSETAGVTRTNEPVGKGKGIFIDFNALLVGNEPANCTKEVRVTQCSGANCATETQIDAVVYNETYSGGKCNSGTVAFLSNVSANSQTDYYLYWNNPSASAPSVYDTNFLISSNATDEYLDLNWGKININKGGGGIKDVEVGGKSFGGLGFVAVGVGYANFRPDNTAPESGTIVNSEAQKTNLLYRYSQSNPTGTSGSATQDFNIFKGSRYMLSHVGILSGTGIQTAGSIRDLTGTFTNSRATARVSPLGATYTGTVTYQAETGTNNTFSAYNSADAWMISGATIGRNGTWTANSTIVYIPADTTLGYVGMPSAAANHKENFTYMYKISAVGSQAQHDEDVLVLQNLLKSTIGAAESSVAAPKWSANATKYPSPQAYDTAKTYGFEIKWSADAKNSTFRLGRPSGTMTDYTKLTTPAVQNNTNAVYWINFTQDQLGSAGVYNYSWLGYVDAVYNQTDIWNYAINKASTTIYLAINGTQSDAFYTYPAVANATAWKTVSEGTLTLLRNGSSVSNPETIQPAAGVYNYTASLSHENYTASAVQRILAIDKKNSELSLTSSSGWTISSGASTSVGCSAVSPLSVTLKKDGITVANPYAAVLASGYYTFSCLVSDSQNYTPSSASNVLNVIEGGVGCTDNSTYAYRLSLSILANITLNFTDLVNQHIVRSDLNDVFVNASGVSMAKNTTGYFILINSTTASGFDIYFGNYYINNNIPEASRTNLTATNFTYSQSSPYFYSVNLNDEMTSSMILPPDANLTSLVMYCSGGATIMNVNHTQFSVAANKQLTQMEYVVQYSASEIYYRDLLISNPIENKNFYIVDANSHRVVQMLLQLQDNSMTFANPVLHIKKLRGDQLVVITERPFDAEKKVIVYLTNGQQYQISVTFGSLERQIGYLYTDTVNLIKTIVINPTVTTDFAAGNITYSLTFSNQTGVITFVWKDPAANTVLSELWVYNYTSDALLWYSNSTNVTDGSMSYATGDPNATYLAKIAVHHTIFGLNTFEIALIFGGIFGVALLPFVIPTASLILISGIIIVSVPMLFGPIHGGTAGVFVALFGMILAVLGFYPVAIPLLVIGLALAVINKITERKVES